MAKLKLNALGGLVYSTDPNFIPAQENISQAETLLPSQQKLKVRLDTKHRAGKAVTLIDGFIGSQTDKEELGRKLKAFCGTGGSVKDGDIIVQGDNRDRVLQWLQKNGFTLARKI